MSSHSGYPTILPPRFGAKLLLPLHYQRDPGSLISQVACSMLPSQAARTGLPSAIGCNVGGPWATQTYLAAGHPSEQY